MNPKQVDEKVIPDFEGMQICLGFEANKKDPKACKIIDQPAIGNKVNLYSCISISNKGEFKIVTKAVSNDRRQRKRPHSNSKDEPMLLNAPADSQKEFFV